MYEFNDAARRQSASSRGTAALCLPIIIPNGKDVLFVKWQTDFFFAVYQCHFSRETEKKTELASDRKCVFIFLKLKFGPWISKLFA